MYTQKSDWVTKAEMLRPGVFLARTLLPESDLYAAVYTMNGSGNDQFLRGGLCLGVAEPGVCVCLMMMVMMIGVPL